MGVNMILAKFPKQKFATLSLSLVSVCVLAGCGVHTSGNHNANVGTTSSKAVSDTVTSPLHAYQDKVSFKIVYPQLTSGWTVESPSVSPADGNSVVKQLSFSLTNHTANTAFQVIEMGGKVEVGGGSVNRTVRMDGRTITESFNADGELVAASWMVQGTSVQLMNLNLSGGKKATTAMKSAIPMLLS